MSADSPLVGIETHLPVDYIAARAPYIVSAVD
jgi:hypothetical protein